MIKQRKRLKLTESQSLRNPKLSHGRPGLNRQASVTGSLMKDLDQGLQ